MTARDNAKATKEAADIAYAAAVADYEAASRAYTAEAAVVNNL